MKKTNKAFMEISWVLLMFGFAIASIIGLLATFIGFAVGPPANWDDVKYYLWCCPFPAIYMFQAIVQDEIPFT